MMDDQANDLRRLVRQGLQEETPCGRSPRLILVTSGKGGVGTTTLAVGMAASAAQRGRRIVLVDANPHGGDVAVLCHLSERRTLVDVLLARCTLDEALQPGPAAMRVLPGAWGEDIHEDYSATAQQRLLDQLRRVETPVDYVLIDAGCGSGRVLRRFWQAVDVVVAVTTAEIPSVMDTYAAIKLLTPNGAPPTVLSLINQVPNKLAADDAHERLERACRRFLGMGLERAGHVGPQRGLAAAVRAGDPLGLLGGRSGREIAVVTDAVLAAADRSAVSQPVRMTA
jgi:flagellar biosynthesis protein FlhG